MAALGSFNTDKDHFKWEVLDKCLPLKTIKLCSVGFNVLTQKKSLLAGKKVGEFKGWGQWMDITQN